jgi:hypothetical protein
VEECSWFDSLPEKVLEPPDSPVPGVHGLVQHQLIQPSHRLLAAEGKIIFPVLQKYLGKSSKLLHYLTTLRMKNQKF